MEVRIEQATVDHVLKLVPRQADIDEVYAACGLTANDALLSSINLDGEHFAGFVDDELVCIFGVGGLYGVGIPYMIGTDNLMRHRKSFLVYSRGFIDKMKRRYSYMTNFVDARNVASIAWLKWLGFSIDYAVPFGFLGLPFHRFHMGEK